jgi:small subunit ribosomal protein S4e
MNLTYRMLLTDKGKLTLVPVDEAEAAWEICKIENKTVVKGGKFQLNLSGGRNIVLDKNEYKCGDSLKVGFDGQAILGHYPMQAGACVLIRFGSQAGAVRAVKSIETVRGPAENRILFTDGTETVASNCIVIGADKPEIKLPEASE